MSGSRFSRVLLVLLALPGVCRADLGDDDFEFARNLHKSERYERAADAFAAFLSKHKDHRRVPLARMYYGLTLSNLNRYSDARDQFSAFVRNHPTNKHYADAAYRVGECSFYLRDYATAEKQLRDFRRAHPEHQLVNYAYLFEGDSQLGQRKWDVARKTFETLLSRSPDKQTHLDAEYGLGRSHEGRKDVAQAFRYYNKLVASRDRVVAPRALWRMGGLYYAAGDFEAAGKAYSHISDKFPKSSLAAPGTLNAGLAYLNADQFKQALLWLNKAKADERNRPQADLYEANCLIKLRRVTEAETLLKAAFAKFGETTAGPELLYLRAESLRLADKPAAAKDLFRKVAADWPEHGRADDALYFAAEAAMKLDQPAEAEGLLDQLDKDHPKHEFGSSAHLLRGRAIAARGNEDALRAAVAEFEAAARTASEDRPRALSAYYLARTHQKLKDHNKAIETAEPLIAQLRAGKHKDMAGVLVLVALSHLRTDQFADAVSVSGEYLKTAPQGVRLTDALEVRAVANAHLAKRKETEADLNTLSTVLSEERFGTVVHTVAEIAWAAKSFAWSEKLYDVLSRNEASPLRPNGYSGLGWSCFEQQKYAAAATAFGAMSTSFPKHRLTPEADYMRARSLEKQQKTGEALQAYLATYKAYLPAAPVEAGAESRPPERFAFGSGRRAADLLEGDGKLKEADGVLVGLIERFPQAARLDELLEHRAFLHFYADDFDTSDKIFRELIEKCPTSPLVPKAKLALAESDLDRNNSKAAETVFSELVAGADTPETVREGALFHLIEIHDIRQDEEKLEMYLADYRRQFPNGRLVNRVSLYESEVLLRAEKFAEVQKQLTGLRDTVAASKPEKWHGRIWVVLAESYFQQKDYAKVRETITDLSDRLTESQYLYQGRFVVGRSWMQQAPPDFDKARAEFDKVIIDPHGQKTELAAKAQLMIGDCWVNQEHYDKALDHYFRAYLNFKGMPSLQADGLFKAAQCEENLKQYPQALKSYRDLLREFPQSAHSVDAQKRITELESRVKTDPGS